MTPMWRHYILYQIIKNLIDADASFLLSRLLPQLAGIIQDLKYRSSHDI